MKRAFDVVASAGALVALSPFLLVIAFLIKRQDGGPALYGHMRVGRDGRTFRCLKFRSMVVEADRVLAEHLARDPAARSEWAATRKLKRDPRITPVGRFLRRTSLDELPQLINIFRGEMSVVGPRPVVREELELYGARLPAYLSVRPGLTGLWQVSGRNDVSYARRVALDTRYVTTWSMRRDVAIILRTIPAVLRSRGCY